MDKETTLDELVAMYTGLTSKEQKIIMALLSSIQSKDEDFTIYKISAKDLDIDKDLGESAKRLLGRRLVLSRPEDGFTLITGWISSYSYSGGYLELCFDSQLRPYLLQLKERFDKK